MERQWVRVGLCVCIGIAVCFWTVEGNGGFTLPPGPAPPDYKADEAVYEDGGMGPLYNFARKFINMCLSDIKDVLKGEDATQFSNFSKNLSSFITHF